jgi:putative SOS response-associated peptidase YedK
MRDRMERMCGRFVVARAANELVEFYDVDSVAEQLPGASHNVAPTQDIAILVDAVNRAASAPGADPDLPPTVRRLESARWGLVPGFAKDASYGAQTFNARIETAAEKPAFQNAVAKRRAAIPATGYYEWSTAPDGTKTPYFVHAPDDEVILFAGLYEWWRKPDAADDDPDRWLLSASILTRAATGRLAGIHDRMPVFLEPGLLEDWLDPTSVGGAELLDEMAAAAVDLADELEFHTVGSAVGSVRNDSPELVLPAGV